MGCLLTTSKLRGVVKAITTLLYISQTLPCIAENRTRSKCCFIKIGQQNEDCKFSFLLLSLKIMHESGCMGVACVYYSSSLKKLVFWWIGSGMQWSNIIWYTKLEDSSVTYCMANVSKAQWCLPAQCHSWWAPVGSEESLHTHGTLWSL